MLAEFVLLLYYPISESIFTYIFPVSELVYLETICSCSYFLFDYENLIYVPVVETLDPFKHFYRLPLPYIFIKNVDWGALIYRFKFLIPWIILVILLCTASSLYVYIL